MIQPSSRVRVADNTGARVVECIRVLGRSEFILRFPSAIAGMLLVPLTYALGRRWLDEPVGLGLPDQLVGVVSRVPLGGIHEGLQRSHQNVARAAHGASSASRCSARSHRPASPRPAPSRRSCPASSPAIEAMRRGSS